MGHTLDLTRGGYGGDAIEEAFKPFTGQFMQFWWHFREVLRSSPSLSPHWARLDGSPMPDEEQRELVALSLLNYSVYVGVGEALTFRDRLRYFLNAQLVPQQRTFQVKRVWKAAYSSLYTSFNSLANIVYVLVKQVSAFGEDPANPWNYTPKKVLDLVKGRGLPELAEPLQHCKDRLVIRDHLDHFWFIWHSIVPGRFLIDENFTKGYTPLRPESEVSTKTDAYARCEQDIQECAADYNAVYEILSVSGGWLDKYLQAKGWVVDYSDFGCPHNGTRPKP